MVAVALVLAALGFLVTPGLLAAPALAAPLDQRLHRGGS